MTGTGYAASAFSSDRVGDGRSMYEYIERYNWRRAYYHHGNSAIAEAGFAKVAGSKIHSIALSAGDEGTPILQQISSAGSFYNTTNPAELTTIFSQIAAAISNTKGGSDYCSSSYTEIFEYRINHAALFRQSFLLISSVTILFRVSSVQAIICLRFLYPENVV